MTLPRAAALPMWILPAPELRWRIISAARTWRMCLKNFTRSTKLSRPLPSRRNLRPLLPLRRATVTNAMTTESPVDQKPGISSQKLRDKVVVANQPGCRFCGTKLQHTFVDLGMSPLCESFLSAEQLNQMEPFYPLHV